MKLAVTVWEGCMPGKNARTRRAVVAMISMGPV